MDSDRAHVGVSRSDAHDEGFHVLAGDSPGRSIIQVEPEHIMSALTQKEAS